VGRRAERGGMEEGREEGECREGRYRSILHMSASLFVKRKR